MYPEATDLASAIAKAKHILVIQADNPDGDSLGSALALEQILGDMDKEVSMYCGVDMPAYLRYMAGWDRVQRELPKDFDLSIIVDASTMSLLEKLQAHGGINQLRKKPCAVLDHHGTSDNSIDFATVVINDSRRASAGELIYLLAKQQNWPLSLKAAEFITISILGDTQGLSNQLASSDTYRVVADLIDQGVNRPAIEEKRRQYSKMTHEIYSYKARLIGRTEFYWDNRIATVTIPQDEIKQYSPLYNPAPLIQGDMLQVEGVMVAIVFKVYDDGKITAAIRCNPSGAIGARLAEHFGGGGHQFASGFKITDGRSLGDIKSDSIEFAHNLLEDLANQGIINEAV